jgi:hypothetical protein
MFNALDDRLLGLTITNGSMGVLVPSALAEVAKNA